MVEGRLREAESDSGSEKCRVRLGLGGGGGVEESEVFCEVGGAVSKI